MWYCLHCYLATGRLQKAVASILLVISSQSSRMTKLKGSRCHGGNLQTLDEGSLLSQLERNLRFPRTSTVFPAQKHQTSKRHINLQNYTNSQSHASIFVIPANKFSALKNTHIYLDQKKLKRSQQWTLKERYGNEGRQHKFKFWRKLLSTTKHQMQLFQ